eukprot:CAMPEP_0198307088 /NCGR_PEP_ID=MMETSP1450-20131203/6_1 /TAXON_ID=753684 ORGANISM="Madagascaria erythrocladiodes, Strain CCMP3234" /NCGR_SAMPLE_ID=MMETSP1450 /ASSEMBLY_ACC=CAM_ASM_001115 /LENGTH=76 /DNA_ID=CAMNT_0044009649 /DNA_START=838 /DNA_END=1068 /DNA_ORIENTATION=-
MALKAEPARAPCAASARARVARYGGCCAVHAARRLLRRRPRVAGVRAVAVCLHAVARRRLTASSELSRTRGIRLFN